MMFWIAAVALLGVWLWLDRRSVGSPPPTERRVEVDEPSDADLFRLHPPLDRYNRPARGKKGATFR